MVHKTSQEMETEEGAGDIINANGEVVRKDPQAKDNDAELGSLTITQLPLYKENSRGIFVMRLKGISFTGLSTSKKETPDGKLIEVKSLDSMVHNVMKKSGKGAPEVVQIESVFMLFKTSRMTMRTKTMIMDIKSLMVPIFNDIISLKIGDKNELIDVKLFKENPGGEDIQLFAGRIIVKEILELTTPVLGSSWKKVANAEIVLDIDKKFPIAPILKIDCQFRQSKFTRMPQGTLEVILAKGKDLKYKNESFRPILEICVGSQRIV